MNTTEQPTPSKTSHEQIAALAYQLWEQGGRVSGHDQEYWFQAEKQLKVACAPTVAQATSPNPNPKPVSQARNGRGNHHNRGSNGPLRTNLARA